VQRLVADLNRLYRAERALWESDYDVEGFRWIDCTDQESSIFIFLRQTPDRASELIVILNLTPAVREHYRVGLTRGGRWAEVLNSDATGYGGSNVGNLGGVTAEEVRWHDQPHSAEFTLPPLSVMVLRPER
jgi:1,4-alpha-glucan branching enzyme